MDDTTRRLPAHTPAASSDGALVAHAVSECGPIRKGNEDAFIFDLDIGLFVVADGMGGHAAGEVASRLAVETILAFVKRSGEDEDFTWPFEFDGSISMEANRLQTALRLANRRVMRAASSHEDYNGMGTTVVAAFYTPSTLVVAHAGDSRAYAQFDGHLTPLTRDDSLAAAMEDAGTASADGPAGLPPRNLLVNALGGHEHVAVHVSERPRTIGARLLLCSDGVHGVLDDERIGGILASRDHPRRQAERLVADAIAAGGRDNATALVVADREAV